VRLGEDAAGHGQRQLDVVRRDGRDKANDSAESRERDGPMGELMTKMDQVKDWGEKIGRIGAVGGFLINLLTFMITIPQPFGLIAAGAYFAYKVISGEITFELIGQAFRDLMSIIELIGANLASILPDWLVNLWNYLNGKTWDEILNDMIMKMAGFLGDMFPSARRVIDALAGVAATVISTIARVIRAIVDGSFGLDDFLDICRSVGGAVLTAVIALVGDAVVEAVGDAVNAVGDFIGSLW
jgi:hypothetical protein